MVAHPGLREEVEPAGILRIPDERRVIADLWPEGRPVEREGVARALAADDNETAAQVPDEAALVAVRPARAERAVARRAGTAVRAGEVEREPPAGNQHVLCRMRDVAINDIHALDHRVADRKRGLEHNVMEDPTGHGAGHQRRS